MFDRLALDGILTNPGYWETIPEEKISLTVLVFSVFLTTRVSSGFNFPFDSKSRISLKMRVRFFRPFFIRYIPLWKTRQPPNVLPIPSWLSAQIQSQKYYCKNKQEGPLTVGKSRRIINTVQDDHQPRPFIKSFSEARLNLARPMKYPNIIPSKA